MTAIALRRAYFAYPSAPAHKLLTDNRDSYIAQSALTRSTSKTARDRTVAPYWHGHTTDLVALAREIRKGWR